MIKVCAIYYILNIYENAIMKHTTILNLNMLKKNAGLEAGHVSQNSAISKNKDKNNTGFYAIPQTYYVNNSRV